jgi:tRNA(fMet)-specific endonuclease VapC
MPCLDTSFILDLYGRGGADRMRRAVGKLEEMERSTPTDIVITRFTFAELLVGVERHPNRPRELKLLEDVTDEFEILEFDEAAARQFGVLKAQLLNIGRMPGDIDVLIGAVALSHGEMLVTGNPKHFTDMPGLNVESY